MTHELLDTAALMAWSGIHRRPQLMAWLDEDPPIPYKLTPKGDICTTLGAVTEALLQREKESKPWAA